jgi:hypothetical protein
MHSHQFPHFGFHHLQERQGVLHSFPPINIRYPNKTQNRKIDMKVNFTKPFITKKINDRVRTLRQIITKGEPRILSIISSM